MSAFGRHGYLSVNQRQALQSRALHHGGHGGHRGQNAQVFSSVSPVSSVVERFHAVVESYHAATGFNGRICSAPRAAWNAPLFAIIGSIVSILTMPVVFTTAAMSGAAMSGAIALLRSAAPSV